MTSCYSCTGSCTSSVTHVRSKSHPTTEHSSNYQLIHTFSVFICLLSQVSGTYTDLGANSDDYTYEQVGWSPDKSEKEIDIAGWTTKCPRSLNVSWMVWMVDNQHKEPMIDTKII